PEGVVIDDFPESGIRFLVKVNELAIQLLLYVERLVAPTAVHRLDSLVEHARVPGKAHMTVPEIALRLQLELDSDAFEEILVLIAVVNEAVDELDLIALRIKVQPHHKGEKLP